ncbi:cell division protein FtsA [Thiospirochaeta perfilievii]|uniref:Cell division protein FtsA n=1 Tax=Thiospirochaeta perfilievii TaxID=252967 RepID=A0A5C1QAQ6_9SPIO|nr:cell division protein FtsA [Thiospirochaeta perfilievii]
MKLFIGKRSSLLDDLVVSLDIGSTTIRVVIAEYNTSGKLHIVGWGSAPSKGVRVGVITNMEEAIKAVSSAISAAEQMAGRTVTHLYTGIAGGSIECYNSKGVVAVTDRGKEITTHDVDRVLEAAKALVIPLDRQILHVIPQEYTIDGQSGIYDPVNMIGVRLEAEVHIITCSLTSTDNIVKCVNRGNYYVNEIVLESLAVSECVLTRDEKELGVLLIDIGGGTTDVLLHYGGAPYYTNVVPMGGDIFTNDISKVLNTPILSAENIKLREGCCVASYVDSESEIIIPGIAGRPPLTVTKTYLAEIIEARACEMFNIIGTELRRKGFGDKYPGGVVLTGGSSLLPGIADLATEILGVQTRIGLPQGVSGLTEELRHPGFSTAVGLVSFIGKKNKNTVIKRKDLDSSGPKKENLFKRVFKHFI